MCPAGCAGPEAVEPESIAASAQVAGVGAETATGPLREVAGREFMRWRSGEPGALERLVRQVTPTLWHLARAYRLDRSAAEDVVQTTWLALARRSDSVRDPEAILGWLSVVTRREAWRVAKESMRETSTEVDVLDRAVPAVPAVDIEVIADVDARALWRQVARLPERCRRLLRIIAFADRPRYSSVSAELGMPHGSIGPTRRRCLDQLRELLAADAERTER